MWTLLRALKHGLSCKLVCSRVLEERLLLWRSEYTLAGRCKCWMNITRVINHDKYVREGSGRGTHKYSGSFNSLSLQTSRSSGTMRSLLASSPGWTNGMLYTVNVSPIQSRYSPHVDSERLFVFVKFSVDRIHVDVARGKGYLPLVVTCVIGNQHVYEKAFRKMKS